MHRAHALRSQTAAAAVAVTPRQMFRSMSTLSTTTTPARVALDAHRANAILNFWFCSVEHPKKNFELWFGGTPAIDQDIKSRFLDDVQLAERGEYDSWLSEPLTSLALIISLDQFPLNIYRNDRRGFVLSASAIPFAYTAVGRGYPERVHEDMRLFFYLPLMHSEHAEDQRRCVELLNSSEHAVHHADIVRKYGRFPGRNGALGRATTSDEAEYLRQGGVF